MVVQNIDLYVAVPFTKVYSGKISGILRYGDWMTAWLCEFLSKNIVGACWKMQVAAKCKTNYSLVK